ncbi:MAG: HDIG domain-containing protein [Anaerolineales bacterium]|jgi:putative nucleotidyltransferase with HDIG domain|nr:HDIG domain-containing protein [Anaerolineales bacterium]
MIAKKQSGWWSTIPRHDILALALLVLSSLSAYAILTAPITLKTDAVALQAGQVAPQDYQAPRNAEYISEVRTEQARRKEETNIADIYSAPDRVIARRQVELLRAALQFIQAVRDDPNALPADKRASLAALADVSLSEQALNSLLAMSDVRWAAAQNEAISLLERMFRNPIRERSLESTRQSIPGLVSFSLNEDQTNLVVELVSPFIVTNSFFSEEQTIAAREQARQAVQPITQTYVAGEMIVQRGAVLTEANIEALRNLELIKPGNPTMDYLSSGALVTVAMVFIGLYYYRRRPYYYNEGRSLLLIAILFLLFLLMARLLIPSRTLVPYFFPIPAFGLLIATLFGPGGALLLSLILSVLAGYNLSNSFDLTFYFMFASLISILSLGKAQRFGTFIWAGFVAALSGISALVAYRMPQSEVDILGFFQLIGAALLMGLLSASLALMLQYLLAEFLGLTTPLRLVEISRPDAPLLQYLLRNAPGTYQHSLQVSNLAEQAAERLGMDTLLMRVGVLYHDVGKAKNPAFFIENQLPDNLNPHDDINPYDAAQTIIQHVNDSVALAKKHRLPKRIQDFMREHHGTLITRYQYMQAVKAAGDDASQVDESKFRYPGPSPRSRETALLMLADGVEARSRSMRPKTEEELRKIVQQTIDFCQKEGQLAETRFTLKDLTLITESFVSTLTGLYHPRIAYPSSAEVRAIQDVATQKNEKP